MESPPFKAKSHMRRFLPSLPALQAFESAARHLSFTRAAEDLMLTQSAVSRHINNLESSLGVRLFERTGSRLVLTDTGASLAEDLRQSLDRLEEVAIDAVRGRKARTSLVIAAQPTYVLRWLMPRLHDFTKAHPQTPLEITELPPGYDASHEPLEIEKADIAILRGVSAGSSQRSRRLFQEYLTVVAAPALASMVTDSHAPIDFRALPTLQNASRPSLWLGWLRASSRAYEGAIQGLRLPRTEMLIQAALAGHGFAVVPAHYVTEDLASGRLIQPFGAPVPSGESYWLVIPEARAHRQDLLTMRDWLLRQGKITENLLNE